MKVEGIRAKTFFVKPYIYKDSSINSIIMFGWSYTV